MNDDWTKQFESLLSSPLGKELVRSLLEDLHDTLVSKAEDADSQESAFGLIKQASGVIKTIDHLQFRAVVPKGKESKVK